MTPALTDLDWRQMPALSALRAFEAAARLGSFAQAARALNVTAPAIAQQVRGLETELAQPLFQRAGRGQVLTAAGQSLLQDLNNGFGQIQNAVTRIRQGGQTRSLRAMVSPGMAISYLMPRLTRFWAKHPEIMVSVVPRRGFVDPGRAGFDLALFGTDDGKPPPSTESEMIRLFSTRAILVAAPALLATGKPLQELPWLLDDEDPSELDLMRDAGIDTDRIAKRHVGDIVLSIDAARVGHGLLFVSEAVVFHDLMAGRLVEVPFPPCAEITYWMAVPKGPRPPALTAFSAWIHEEIALARRDDAERLAAEVAVSRETGPK